MIKRIVFCCLFMSTLVINSHTQAKGWEALFEHAEYQEAKISPDGKYLAVSVFTDNKMALAFLDRKSLATIGSAKFPGTIEVGNFHWVNNERVVIEINKQNPWQEKPMFTGELFAVNFDGTRNEMIYGFKAGEMQTGSHVKKKESIYGWAKIIDTLPEDDKHILISSTPIKRTRVAAAHKLSGEKLSTVFKLNVYTGVIKKDLGRAPIRYSQFLTDTKGDLKVVIGTDKNNKQQLYIRKDEQWQLVPESAVGPMMKPLSISHSGEHLYTIDNYQQDLKGVFKLNLENFAYKNVYTDKTVDITDVEMTTDGRSAYAIRVDESYPSYLILNKKLEEAKVTKTLLKSFPYSEIKITSRTKNGDFYVVSVTSDVDPGALYLFDKKANRMEQLFKFKPEFKSNDFIQVEPIKLAASDGKTIHGFFTPAKESSKGKIAPLVVLVHPNPNEGRDYWSFSSQVQYLVLNGYSVLQVNYRGSIGYGSQYQAAGYGAWGDKIQQDILESYQWLVKQNKALPGKACIMGANFGAYSAVQSVAIYPGAYQCAIANAGIYDLEMQLDRENSKNTGAGKNDLAMVLGTDKKALNAISPVNYVENIKVPILLTHNVNDEKSEIEQTERLKNALDKVNTPYLWHVVDKKENGFYNPENQKAYMKKVVSFLDKNLL